MSDRRPARSGSSVTVFRKRPAMLALFLLMGAAFTVQGFATAIVFSTASHLEQPIRSAAVGVSLFLALAGIWFGAQALRRIAGPDDAIVIGPAGLHDRLISAEPIPWRSLRDIRVARGARGASVVAFDLEGEERQDIHRWPRLAEPVNRAFGYGYYVFVMGTEASVERLGAAIEPHAPIRRAAG